MFIDSVKINVEAGNGGNGIIAFRREKFVELGGPFGGSGGKGGNIILKVDSGLNTLLDFNYNKKYIAPMEKMVKIKHKMDMMLKI